MNNFNKNNGFKEIGTVIKIMWVFIILMIISLIFNSCKTKYIEVPIENTRIEYKTNLKHDSIYFRDSITTYILGDTVYKEKIQYRFKYRNLIDTVTRIDTFNRPVYIPNIVKKQYQESSQYKIEDGLKYSGILFWVLLIVFTIIKIKNVF